MRRIATQGQEDSRMRVACPATTWPAIVRGVEPFLNGDDQLLAVAGGTP